MVKQYFNGQTRALNLLEFTITRFMERIIMILRLPYSSTIACKATFTSSALATIIFFGTSANTIANTYIADISFEATIDRLVVPEGKSTPDSVKTGNNVTGHFRFAEGRKGDVGVGDLKSYDWITKNDRPTVTVELDNPLNAGYEGAYLLLNPSISKTSINCGTTVRTCNFSGDGIQADLEDTWKPSHFSVQAPGTVDSEFTQLDTVKQLVELAPEKNAKMLVSYKLNPEDSGTKALKVILIINSMSLSE